MTSEDTDAEQRTDGRHRQDRSAEDAVGVIATSTVRIGLLILGILLLLYAVGQAVGFDVMAMLSDALATQEARWMIVAFFALILIAIAIRGFQ